MWWAGAVNPAAQIIDKAAFLIDFRVLFA